MLTFLFQTAQDSRCHKDLTFIYICASTHLCNGSVGDTQTKLLKFSISLPPDQRLESDALLTAF